MASIAVASTALMVFRHNIVRRAARNEFIEPVARAKPRFSLIYLFELLHARISNALAPMKRMAARRVLCRGGHIRLRDFCGEVVA